MGKYLKKFQNHSQYESYIATNYVKPNVSYCVSENEVHYNPFSYADEYLTFEVVEGGTITFAKNDSQAQDCPILYSTDNGTTWTELTPTTTSQELGGTLSVGDKVLVKGTNAQYALNPIYYNRFGGTAKVNISGNIMSLIGGDNFSETVTFTERFALYGIFSNYSNLLSAENLILPATTLVDDCYCNMFRNCTNLVNAPKSLPATTLTIQCYCNMFRNCTNLVNAPELPAETLAGYCYGYMFSGCTSLTTAPELPATTLAQDCYYFMFQGCTGLTTAPALPATTLASNCYCSSCNNISK